MSVDVFKSQWEAVGGAVIGGWQSGWSWCWATGMGWGERLQILGLKLQNNLEWSSTVPDRQTPKKGFGGESGPLCCGGRWSPPPPAPSRDALQPPHVRPRALLPHLFQKEMRILLSILGLLALGHMNVDALSSKAIPPLDHFTLLQPYKFEQATYSNLTSPHPLFSPKGLASSQYTAPRAPWVVRLVVDSTFDPLTLEKRQGYVCSGALIDYDTVLTSADCVTLLDTAELSSMASSALPMAMLKVQAGEGQQEVCARARPLG